MTLEAKPVVDLPFVARRVSRDRVVGDLDMDVRLAGTGRYRSAAHEPDRQHERHSDGLEAEGAVFAVESTILVEGGCRSR